MTLTVGAMFAGIGGLELGVAAALDAEVAWCAEVDPGSAKVLAARWPGVPNVGDVTTVDWRDMPPVDVITGGTPCQDLSNAGRLVGMRRGTRSGLWVSMWHAIDALRPSLVVWENVRGALSAGADCEVEPCPGCVGTGHGGPVLRALGRVLGDMASIGYDAAWVGLRAADMGLAHNRFRIFVLAAPADPAGDGRAAWSTRGRVPTLARTEGDTGAAAGLTLLPTPTVSDTYGAGDHGDGGLDLRTAVQLLPTPTVSDAKSSGAAGYGGNEFNTLTDATVRKPDRWGDYAAAIARHEATIGRAAPAPTETSPKGGQRLSPRFVEWMQGLPDGWVTDCGISRNAQLRALGNAVVPQQAAAALRWYLDLDMAA